MNRQKEILQCFKADYNLILKKSEIKDIGKIEYYYNTDKHLGDTLTRMVKNNSLIRVSKGKYKLGSGNKNKNIVNDKNQTKLWN